MNGQSFVGNMPQPLNFADCSSAELDRKLMELWLMPLYHARYRKLDAPENPGLWYRVLEVQKQLSALEQLANRQRPRSASACGRRSLPSRTSR